LVFPKIGTALLQALWGSAPNDVYAVGSEGVLHYDGNAWSTIATGVQDNLHDIWGSDKSNIYAVGGINNDNVGIALHFDGQSWSNVNISTSHSWRAVWGSGAQDVFVAGGNEVAHFDGSTWKSSEPPVPEHGSLQVFKCNTKEVFAIDGDDLALYRLDGSAWSRYPRQPFDNFNLFNQRGTVWCASADDIWLISSDSENNGVRHWNGITWNGVPSAALHKGKKSCRRQQKACERRAAG
jgi:hypothetical protein